MQTKTKADQHKKLLITAIKKTVNYNTVLPILGDVFLSGKEAIVTDLENIVIIPYEAKGINACIPADKFIDILEMTGNGVSITQGKVFDVSFQEDKRIIKIIGENPDNFPKNPSANTNQVGTFTEKELRYLTDALCFVSNDDLRPALTGIFCGKDIVATDAHRMMWRPIDGLDAEFLLPQKGVRILLALGGDKWDIFTDKDKNHITFKRADGVQVITRAIDARYPSYKEVIPNEKDVKAKIVTKSDTILKELMNAGKFANSTSKQVSFLINSKVSLSSEDIDFSFEYKNELTTTEAEVIYSGNKKPEPLTIAFNYKFLAEMISKQPKNEPISIRLFSSHKAAIINEGFLLMPLLLNQ